MGKYVFTGSIMMYPQAQDDLLPVEWTQTNGPLDAAGTGYNDWTPLLGYILGSTGGVGETGITLSLNRVFEDQARIGGFTRPISSFLALGADVTFEFPWVGNRKSGIVGAPAQADLLPIKAVEALLNGSFMEPTAATTHWDTGSPASVWSPNLVPGSTPFPFSLCIYANGERVVAQNCRCALSIDYTAQQIPTATATISVGEILLGTGRTEGGDTDSLTTSDATGDLAASASNVISSRFTWGSAHDETGGGFDSMTFDVNAANEDVPDSNQITGRVIEPSDLTYELSGTVYKDDRDKVWELTQLQAKSTLDLQPVSFEVPHDGTQRETPSSGVPRATSIRLPRAEFQSEDLAILGTRGSFGGTWVGREETANAEAELYFF